MYKKLTEYQILLMYKTESDIPFANWLLMKVI